MAEYIECRKCDSFFCDGCNIFTLAKMLRARKFECLMDEHHAVDQLIDVEPVKHGRWEHDSVGFDDFWRCTFCREDWFFDYDPTKESTRVNYCPNCGARMEVDNG